MKPIYANFGGALALSFAIGACVPAPDSTPAPTAAPTPTPVASTPAPVQPPAPPPAENWIDEPRTPGNWSYHAGAEGGAARFGEAGSEAQFSIECDASAKTITLTRTGQGPREAVMTIRTETTDRTLRANSGASRSPQFSAALAAGDPLLDAMALTRGRFAVEMSGLSTLYLPAWAEVTRVIEDCR
ncbi:MAG: hypothetical protein AB3N06_02750 [Erythrobacter sp.]